MASEEINQKLAVQSSTQTTNIKEVHQLADEISQKLDAQSLSQTSQINTMHQLAEEINRKLASQSSTQTTNIKEVHQLAEEINGKLASHQVADIKKVHDRFPVGSFSEIAGKGTNIKICITWMPDVASFLSVIENALKNDDLKQIRILHLDPESPSFSQRCVSLNYDIKKAEQDFDLLKSQLIEILINKNDPAIYEKLKFSLYTGTPSMRSWICDDVAIVSFWITGKFTSSTPHLEIHKSLSDGFFKTVNDDFETRWRKIRTRELNLKTGKYIKV